MDSTVEFASRCRPVGHFALVALVAALLARTGRAEESELAPETALAVFASHHTTPDADAWVYRTLDLDEQAMGLRALLRGAHALGDEEVRRELRDGRVFLVADVHRATPCRAAAGRLVELLLANGHAEVSLICESLPASLQGAVDAMLRGDETTDTLDARLREHWGGRVGGYGGMVRDLRAAADRVRIVAAGVRLDASTARDPSQRDGRPTDAGLEAMEAPVRSAIESGLARSDAAAVVVLIGGGHVFARPAISQWSSGRGWRTARVVPFDSAWEEAVRARCACPEAWIRVADGVFRAPLVTDAEVVTWAREEDDARGRVVREADERADRLLDQITADQKLGRGAILEELGKLADVSVHARRALVAAARWKSQRSDAILYLSLNVRCSDVFAIDFLKAVASNAEEKLHDRESAAEGLARVFAEPAICVPLLAGDLARDFGLPPKFSVAHYRRTLVLLGHLGPAARDAVPAIEARRSTPGLTELADRVLREIR